jgi:hypothetical protein
MNGIARWLIGIGAVLESGAAVAADPTPIAEILSLPAEDRNRSAVVTARGVVTLADPDLFFFAIQDGSAGIYVKAMHLATDADWVSLRRSLHLGQEVEVRGVLDRGGFAPVIVASPRSSRRRSEPSTTARSRSSRPKTWR